jgi:hypothetical protein
MDISLLNFALKNRHDMDSVMETCKHFDPQTIFYHACVKNNLELIKHILSLHTLHDLDFSHNDYAMLTSTMKIMSQEAVLFILDSLTEHEFHELQTSDVCSEICYIAGMSGHIDVANRFLERTILVADEDYWYDLCEHSVINNINDTLEWIIKHKLANFESDIFKELFVCACSYGNIISVSIIFSETPIIETDFFHDGFITACEHGKIFVANWILDVGKEEITNRLRSDNGFRKACKKGYRSIVELLLNLYKSCNFESREFNDGFANAFENGFISVLKLVHPYISYNDHLNQSINKFFDTACFDGKYECIKLILSDNKIKIEPPDFYNVKNMISRTCTSGHVDLLSLLLEKFDICFLDLIPHIDDCIIASILNKKIKTHEFLTESLEEHSRATILKRLNPILLTKCFFREGFNIIIGSILKYNTPSDFDTNDYVHAFSSACKIVSIDTIQALVNFDKDETLLNFKLDGISWLSFACFGFSSMEVIEFLIDKLLVDNIPNMTRVNDIFMKVAICGHGKILELFLSKFDGIDPSVKSWKGFKSVCKSQDFHIIDFYEKLSPRLGHKYVCGVIEPIIRPHKITDIPFEKDTLCPICDIVNVNIMLTCKHKFCFDCIGGDLDTLTMLKCPLCCSELEHVYMYDDIDKI